MQVEIGDRVKIKHELFPEGQMYNAGWKDHPNGPGWEGAIDVPSREYWVDAVGVVVSLDTLNQEAVVRGRHKGADYTLVVPIEQVHVTDPGVPR